MAKFFDLKSRSKRTKQGSGGSCKSEKDCIIQFETQGGITWGWRTRTIDYSELLYVLAKIYNKRIVEETLALLNLNCEYLGHARKELNGATLQKSFYKILPIHKKIVVCY